MRWLESCFAGRKICCRSRGRGRGPVGAGRRVGYRWEVHLRTERKISRGYAACRSTRSMRSDRARGTAGSRARRKTAESPRKRGTARALSGGCLAGPAAPRGSAARCPADSLSSRTGTACTRSGAATGCPLLSASRRLSGCGDRTPGPLANS